VIFWSNDSACIDFSAGYVRVYVYAAWHHRKACGINRLASVRMHFLDNLAVLDGNIHLFAINPVNWVEDESVLDEKFRH
jgi:hypothetical protein